jgi:hypothetical protein
LVGKGYIPNCLDVYNEEQRDGHQHFSGTVTV